MDFPFAQIDSLLLLDGDMDPSRTPVHIQKTVVNTRPLDGTAFVAPFVACTPAIADYAVQFAEVVPGDAIVDLGCGDGQILWACLRALLVVGEETTQTPRTHLYGVELDPYLYQELGRRLETASKSISPWIRAHLTYQFAQVTQQQDGVVASTNTPPRLGMMRYECVHAEQPHSSVTVEIHGRDMFSVDLQHECRATVLILYLLPEGLAKLRPALEAWLRSGQRGPADPAKRIITVQYTVQDWQPVRIQHAHERTFYYYNTCSL